jgi:hypothetical protein
MLHRSVRESGVSACVKPGVRASRALQCEIEELRRKASQQLQGEVQELELESMLGSAFVYDTIARVPKGEFGGDVLQRVVMNQTGAVCGTILWVSKRTKTWSDGWLAKLRHDQRAAKADVAVIVSQALPKGVKQFELIDGVYVVSPQCVRPVAEMLRVIGGGGGCEVGGGGEGDEGCGGVSIHHRIKIQTAHAGDRGGVLRRCRRT